MFYTFFYDFMHFFYIFMNDFCTNDYIFMNECLHNQQLYITQHCITLLCVMQVCCRMFTVIPLCQRPLRPRANCQLSIVNYLGLGATGQSQLPHSHRLFFRFISFECFYSVGVQDLLIKTIWELFTHKEFFSAKHAKHAVLKAFKRVYLCFFLSMIIAMTIYNFWIIFGNF